WIEAQRQIRGEHGRLALLVRVERVRNDLSHVFGFPLKSAGWALGQFPFKVEQVLKKEVGPFCRRLAPNDFQPRGNGVGTYTALELAAPAQTLIFDNGRFRLRPYE